MGGIASLPEATERIEELQGTVEQYGRVLVLFERRIAALEKSRDYLDNRAPCRIPPYFKELTAIGLPPPRAKVPA